MSASCETDQRKLSGKNKVWILCISNCSFKWQNSTCEMGILFCKFKVGYLQVVEEKAIGFKPKCEFDAYVCAHSPWTHPLLLLYLLLPLVFLLPLLLRLLLLLLFLLCANVQSSRHLCVYLCVGPKTDGFDQKRLFLPPLAFLLAPQSAQILRFPNVVHKCLANPALWTSHQTVWELLLNTVKVFAEVLL